HPGGAPGGGDRLRLLGRRSGDERSAPLAASVSNPRGFASDNYSGVHPEIVEAILAANEGHVSAYGEDPYTAASERALREHFGDQAKAFPVFNGTGANVDAVDSLTRPYEAVICAAS